MKNHELLTVISKDFGDAEARKLFLYDGETGQFYWKVRPAYKIKIGDRAGNLNPNGYVTIKLGGKQVYAHRLAYLIRTGKWPEKEIDHINGDRSDNRWSNLRVANHSQNQMNKPMQSNNSSGHKGVTWNAKDKRWVAQIQADKKFEVIGRFREKMDAITAYNARATVLHGNFLHGAVKSL